MKNKTIILKVEHTGNEYVDNPEKVRLEITPAIISEIKNAKKYLSEKPEIRRYVELDVQGECLINGKLDYSFKYGTIRISNFSIIYTDFHKHDGTATIETEDLTNKIKL